jgi:hypothetical protein
MCLTVSSEFLQIENWLSILLATYKEHPNCGLAKTIHYYLIRLLHHEDINFYGEKRCEYLCMKKFWGWQAQN